MFCAPGVVSRGLLVRDRPFPDGRAISGASTEAVVRPLDDWFFVPTFWLIQIWDRKLIIRVAKEIVVSPSITL
ncbi:MAG: hypothetical protein ACNA7Q_11950, partial [Rhodobacterales bacterium]